MQGSEAFVRGACYGHCLSFTFAAAGVYAGQPGAGRYACEWEDPDITFTGSIQCQLTGTTLGVLVPSFTVTNIVDGAPVIGAPSSVFHGDTLDGDTFGCAYVGIPRSDPYRGLDSGVFDTYGTCQLTDRATATSSVASALPSPAPTRAKVLAGSASGGWSSGDWTLRFTWDATAVDGDTPGASLHYDCTASYLLWSGTPPSDLTCTSEGTTLTVTQFSADETLVHDPRPNPDSFAEYYTVWVMSGSSTDGDFRCEMHGYDSSFYMSSRFEGACTLTPPLRI